MRVARVSYEASRKTYRLENGREFTTHRFCCLGPGDDVVVKTRHNVEAVCRNGRVKVLPTYAAKDALFVGTRVLRLTVKEIETEEELAGYHQLEEYHYRGTVIHGRRVPLIVCSEDPLLPAVLGYIELATAFLMNRPRARVLNSVFSNGSGIAWESWRKDTVRQYTNLVVRIARTVVSPEFRGLGLARVLVKHAAQFSRSHWQVGGLKPIFLEITADMLRYVPFVESAGMHYIGETEGNLARVNVDMNYILKNFARVKRREILKEESAGIVDLQVYYATRLRQIEREKGIPRDKLLRLLLTSPERLSDDHWGMLHRILRLPKPTFLMGLNRRAESFVRRRVKELALPPHYPAQWLIAERKAVHAAIKVQGCSYTMSSSLIRTRATRKIQQSFGVSRDMLRTTLFSNLSFTIRPGQIVLICGPSGAGKTTLLNLLTRRLLDPKRIPTGLTGTIEIPRDVSVSTLSVLSNTRPLVNALGQRSLPHALAALNVSGLAEAHLYVKRFRELSNGQRYRAMVAKLIASRADVWVADEFCATLDPITANIVSRNLRRYAQHLGATVILAAANWSDFVHELRPDLIVHLRAPWDYRVFSWNEFRKAVGQSHALGVSAIGRTAAEGRHIRT